MDFVRHLKSMDFSRLLFTGSIFLTVFMYGVVVGNFQIFPFSLIKLGKDSVEQVLTERETILRVRPSFLLEGARYKGDGVTRFKRDETVPGLTLLQGFFGDGLEMRLIRLDGSLVNRWPARFHEIFRDTSHIKPPDRIPQTDWNTGIHGALAFPDGSVLFNFEGVGSAKMNRCGAIQWALPEMTHHSVELSEDGSFWIPSTRSVDGTSPFPGPIPPYDEETLLKVSPDGKILQQISVLGLLFENDLQGLFFANGLEEIDVPRRRNLTHLNDIEELKSDMAKHFPQFAAGDLMLSLRNYNLILVVDPRTRKVKWHQTGPWLKQHDPDFQTNGKIAVFNNNSDGTDTGSVFGGSTIMEVDPRTGHTTVRYGGRSTQPMFTKFRGKHQQLENGNTLITESHAGRVFEINPKGDIVWEFINRYSDDQVTIVADAVRYPERYFTVDDWTCRETAATNE